jgi:hypothetical protein
MNQRVIVMANALFDIALCKRSRRKAHPSCAATQSLAHPCLQAQREVIAHKEICTTVCHQVVRDIRPSVQSLEHPPSECVG